MDIDMNDTTQKPTVVAIGNFDGVHKGHAALLKRARAIADSKGLELVALTFEPHPRTFFKPEGKPFRITPETVKERRLKASGAARVDVLDFNQIMADLSAAAFIEIMLVDLLNASHVVVGADFHFGKGRAGHIDTLQADGRFTVDAVTLEESDSAPVSSTRVREALEVGDIAAANALLGWEWEIEGEVVHGDKRGRELGYPTANVVLGDTIVPAHGIYAVTVDVGDGIWHRGAASIGIRPMFEVKTPMLEVFILDYQGDLYGKTIRIRPLKKLRDEQKFDGIEALKTQMAIDVAEVGLLIP